MLLRRLLPLLVLVALPALDARAEDPLLPNGAFAEWTDGLPRGWAAGQGAHLGAVDESSETNRFEPLEGGGVASVGHAGIRRWMMLTRHVALDPETTYRLEFEARAGNLVREGQQFANRWVGALVHDAQGRRLAFPLSEVHTTTFRPDVLHLRTPAGTASAQVGFFCSLSGRFEVRRMALTRLQPRDSFDTLVRDMDRRYPFFARHGIDWAALAAKHRDGALAAATPEAFAEAITPMLAALEDGHVWIDVPGRPRQVPHVARPELNFELAPALGRLANYRQVIRNVLSGRTKQGYGYLAIGTMQGTRTDLRRIDEAWRGLFDAPALVLDLRMNGGGDETWGQHLLGCLADQPLLYGTSRLRSGPGHEDLRPGGRRFLQPRRPAYRKPVVALIGPGCVSSGEAMAMMGRALPDVTLVGLPTRGSSGSPAPIVLPNGVSVWYSRWISLLPDGTLFERRGVPPDVRVPHVRGGDAAFEKALAILAERLAKAAGR